ncbi:hypothetical protein J6590_108445 [Homalodisca vitripennis]|nr:hypothetical protein J6590_108445 [Homalodisca vitripennis]
MLRDKGSTNFQRVCGSPGQHSLHPQESNTLAVAAILRAMLDEVASISPEPSVVEVFRRETRSTSSSSPSLASDTIDIIEHSDTKILPKYSKGKKETNYIFRKL